jgi:hypothetical protein
LKSVIRRFEDHFRQGSKVQQNGTFILVESHKLEPRPLDEDQRPIEAELRWHLHANILEGNSIGLDQKMELNGLENQDVS